MSKHQESEARLQDIQVRHMQLCFVKHSKCIASFSCVCWKLAWPGDTMFRVLGWGCRFDLWLFYPHVTTLGKLFTPVCLSLSISFGTVQKVACCLPGQVAGLVEISSSLLLADLWADSRDISFSHSAHIGTSCWNLVLSFVHCHIKEGAKGAAAPGPAVWGPQFAGSGKMCCKSKSKVKSGIYIALLT